MGIGICSVGIEPKPEFGDRFLLMLNYIDLPSSVKSKDSSC